jgi:hypothetical protein
LTALVGIAVYAGAGPAKEMITKTLSDNKNEQTEDTKTLINEKDDKKPDSINKEPEARKTIRNLSGVERPSR